MTTDTQPWYKQFWPWLLIGLPGTAVIFSLGMLYIAMHKSDDLVEDNYYKDGLAINRQLAADEKAKQLNLRALLSIDPQMQQIKIDLSGALPPQQLTAHFIHPVSAANDFVVTLSNVNGVFFGPLREMPRGRWSVEITANGDATWRLRREIAIPTANSATVEFDIAP